MIVESWLFIDFGRVHRAFPPCTFDQLQRVLTKFRMDGSYLQRVASYKNMRHRLCLIAHRDAQHHGKFAIHARISSPGGKVAPYGGPKK